MAATPKHAARVLGLSLEATLEDIRRVRHKMALKYHPDRCTDKEQATRHMARINAAADTFIAHIQKGPRSNTSGQSPRYENFSARRQDNCTSARSDKTKSQSQSRAQEQDIHAKKKTDQAKRTSRAERTLIRFASASYARVLDRIGPNQTGPTIDVSILGFQGAH